jgi:hypothetical protein
MPRSLKPRIGVFLSHSSKDRKFVLDLARTLKRHGIPHWYSATHIAIARQWHDEIGKALRRCDWFLVVLTPDGVESNWVKRELLFALSDHRYNQKIIPLLRKNCNFSELSWTLSSFQFVDFRKDVEAGFRKLFGQRGVAYKPVLKNVEPKKQKKKG